MKGLALHAKSTKPKFLRQTETETETEFVVDPSWEKADHRNVFIKCKWDNPKFHEQFGPPLYVQWLQLQSQSQSQSQDEAAGNKTEEEQPRQSSPSGKSDAER
jgi:hypothetical protein